MKQQHLSFFTENGQSLTHSEPQIARSAPKKASPLVRPEYRRDRKRVERVSATKVNGLPAFPSSSLLISVDHHSSAFITIGISQGCLSLINTA